MRSVALDLGARKIAFCEVRDGSVVARGTVGGLDELQLLRRGSAAAQVAIEACREAWHVIDVLEGQGHEVALVDTTRVRQLGIGAHKRKTDRIDAEVLARALERGIIPKAHVLSVDRRELRVLLEVRAALVDTRASYVTRIRGLARAWGVPIEACKTKEFLTALADAALTQEQRALVAPLKDALVSVQQQLAIAEARLCERCAPDREMQRLATAPGVALIVAAAFVSVIDSARRFRNAHQVEAYLGLVPSVDCSGSRERTGAITKHGNAYLRSLLVEAAHNVLRSKDPDDPLVRWGKAVKKRRSAQIAAVAVARKLAGVLWAMWRKQTVYEPSALALVSSDGLQRQASDTKREADALARAARKLESRTRKSHPLTKEKTVRRAKPSAVVA
jgi:transposase